MTGTTLPIILAVVGIFAGLMAQRGIRRGGARYYALERDAMLRRASLTLMASIFFFVASVGWLVYNQRATEQAAVEEESAEATVQALVETQTAAQPVQTDGDAPTPVVVQDFPPTPEPAEPTESVPTDTPEPPLRAGLIEGTAGSGVYMREGPGTEYADILILNDGDFIELLEEEPVEANGYTWLKVRDIAFQEGWVADIFVAVDGP